MSINDEYPELSRNENGENPAMPVNADQYANSGGHGYDSFGLTKREHIATMALQGLISEDSAQLNIGMKAVQFADVLLAELERVK